MQDSPGPEEVIFARVIWATHILWFLSANRSQQDLVLKDLDDCDEEGLDNFGDDATDTKNLGLLTSSDEGIKIKFLNGIAELLSPAKGWNYVSATALRESEDSVEVDLVRNGGFGNKESYESPADAGYIAALRNFIDIHDYEEQKLDACRDGCDEFLRATVIYSFRRIDKCMDNARDAFRKSRTFDLFLKFKDFGQERDQQCESACVLDCRTECPMNYNDLRELISILDSAKTPDLGYRAIVLAEKLSSCAMLQNIMSQFAVGGEIENVKRALGFLARPITILRLLLETARLLPNFRDIEFHCLEPPKPIRIAKQFCLFAKEAWLALGLPDHGEQLPKTLEGKMKDFKSLCSRPFSVHAEIQLLLRYQENPGLSPTLDYIGCSKKACLLCEAFLQVSPQKFRVRGRHGGCYPAWGISEAHLKTLCSALAHLSQRLKQRIVQLLKTGSTNLGQAVPQSTIVSNFNSLDLKGTNYLESARRSLESDREVLREKLTRLNDPRSRGPSKIVYADISALCAYCSKLCQEADWPSHKLLCAAFSKQTSRPMTGSRLAIWFPDTWKQPRLVWIGLQKENSFLVPYFDHFLGENHGVLWTIILNQNQRRGVSLEYELTLYYNDSAGCSLPVNKSVRAAAGISAPVPHEWCGPLVLLKGTPTFGFGDVTLVDYRHVLDYFVTYWDTNLHEEPSSNTVWGVKINCHGEKILHGAEKFIRVAVDLNIPEQFEVSPVSKLVNLPVKAAKVKATDAWAEYPEWNYDPDDYGSSARPEHNPEAEALFLGLGDHTKRMGENIGNMLLLRDDGEDMSLEEAETLCGFCTLVLMPTFSQCLRGEISRSEVHRYLTRERFDKFSSESQSKSEEKETKDMRL
ncbi:hypothetical protein MMC17_007689 [Xylographa soralifera]|nr:hypothetical protein [Xylographa soralifera]